MTCQNCGHENAPEAHFCASCGNPFASNVVQPDLRHFEQLSGGLQPRNLGELLIETYYVYRRNFWPFLFIAAVPQGPLLIASVSPEPGSILFSLLGLLLIPLAAGATIYAVVRQHQVKMLDVRECFRYSLQMVVMLIVVIILVALALVASVILAFILIGVPLFFYILVIWFFAPHAIIIERRDPISALGRSRELVRGNWWRVFGIGVVFVLIILGLSSITTLPAVVFASLPTLLENIIAVIISAVLFPIAYIGGTLVYIDLRVRKEGYNLDMMASEVNRS